MVKLCKLIICDALRDLVSFVQFKFHGCFSLVLNCTYGTKSRNTSQSYIIIGPKEDGKTILAQVSRETLTFSKSTIVILEKKAKYVQS